MMLKSAIWPSGLILSILALAGWIRTQERRDQAAIDRQIEQVARLVEIEALSNAFQRALAEGRRLEALELLERLSLLDPGANLSEVIAETKRSIWQQSMCLGHEALAANNYQQAVQEFQQAVHIGPKNQEAELALAKARFQQDRAQGLAELNRLELEAAIASFTRALTWQPTDAECQTLLQQALNQRWEEAMAEGRGFLKQGHYARAIASFNRASELRPDSEVENLRAEATYRECLRLAKELIDQGKFESALSAFRRARHLHPEESRDEVELEQVLIDLAAKGPPRPPGDRTVAGWTTDQQLRSPSGSIRNMPPTIPNSTDPPLSGSAYSTRGAQPGDSAHGLRSFRPPTHSRPASPRGPIRFPRFR